MNWFSKLSQTSTALEDAFSLKGTPEHYQKASHMYHAGNEQEYDKYRDKNEKEHQCTEYMWILLNGGIKYEEVVATEIHSDVWDEVELSKTWSGRYNDCQNIISVTGPLFRNSGMERTPRGLLRGLARTFSPDAPIVWYHDNLNGQNRTRLASCDETCKIG